MKKIIKEYAFYVIIFVLVAIVSPKYVWGKTLVDGHSMENTLHNKDVLFNLKISYALHDPERFDVVTLISPMDETKQWVKRVIGLPGETIQIINGNVYIDGEELTEDIYGNMEIDYAGIAEVPFQIPEGSYFVMGDNREVNMSYDSRYQEVGPFRRDQILAKIIFRTWPISRIGMVSADQNMVEKVFYAENI